MTNNMVKKNNLEISILSIILTIIFGIVNALSCYIFIVPNDFASSGIEGVAVMVQYLTGFNLSIFQLIINIPLCIFAFFCVGKGFAIKTVIYSISYSVAYFVIDKIGLTSFQYFAFGVDTIYPVILCGIITGVSYGILFRENSSTGGVDVISRYINKVKPRYNFFYVTFAINAAIAIISCFVFKIEVNNVLTYSYRPACMCLLCDFISNIVGDTIIKGRQSAIKFYIIADNVTEIANEICEKLTHSSTRFECFGSYSGEKKQSLICVVNKEEITELETILKKYPNAFSFEEPVNKVIGYFDNFKTVIKNKNKNK